MAMDVVDTLRHREQIFLREIDSAGREDELVARLTEIYAAQGMDVPEETIRDGVRAMADKRYEHTPAKPGFMRRLAIIYITRDRWWKSAAAALAAIVAIGGYYQFGVVGPQAAAERRIETQLTQTLPEALTEARDAALAASEDDAGDARAAALFRAGQGALDARDTPGAEAAIAGLTALRSELAADYKVRVVNDPNDFTGIYREHDDIPGRQNYYLIVEAIDPLGAVVPVTVTDEETGETVQVRRWGQRVSKDVFDRVAADKSDDAIIQESVIGEKSPGLLSPRYSVNTPGGALTEW